MITAGIDAGLRKTKVVILNDGKILAKGSGLSLGGSRRLEIEKIWAETLKAADKEASGIQKIVATGQGKFDVPFADDQIVEAIADARAARYYNPGATSIVDVGADQTRVVTLGDKDEIKEVVFNQKCMAGLGLILEVIADRLDYSLEKMGESAPVANIVNDGCPVFAELDALELLNEGVSCETVAGAVTEFVIVRLNSILNDKIVPAHKTSVLVGGVAKNHAVVKGLKLKSGIDFFVPEDPEYAGALGAAVIAGD